VPDLRDLAQEAFKKAQLFGSGAGEDLFQQLSQIPGEIMNPKPPESLLETAIQGGENTVPAMKLMRLMPSIEQSVSSGLGRAGMAGGRDFGLYKPDTPLGDIELGPREAIGLMAGLAIPTGPEGKLANIAKKAEQNIARTIASRMGPGGQRLAARAAERKAAQAAKEAAAPLNVVAKAETAAERPAPAARGLDEPLDDLEAPIPPKKEPLPPRTAADDQVDWTNVEGDTGADWNVDRGPLPELPVAPDEAKGMGIEAAKKLVAERRYKTGIQKVDVWRDEQGGMHLPEGAKPLALEQGDALSLDKRRLVEGDRKSSSGQVNARVAPSMYEDVPDVEQLSDIVEQENKIGRPMLGSSPATGMEKKRMELRQAPQVEKIIQDELDAAGGDPLKTSMIRAELKSMVYGSDIKYTPQGQTIPKRTPSGEPEILTRRVWEDPDSPVTEQSAKPIKDAQGNVQERVETHAPLWFRMQEDAKKYGTLLVNPRNKVKPPPLTEGWQNTPQGKRFLWAEALARRGGDDPHAWAMEEIRKKASTGAHKLDPENPEHGRHYRIKPGRASEMADAEEGVVASDFNEFVGEGGPAGTEAGPHPVSMAELEGGGVNERFDPFSEPRSHPQDARSWEGGGGTQIEFDSPEHAKAYYGTRDKRDNLQKRLEVGLKKTPAQREALGDSWKSTVETLQAKIDDYNKQLGDMIGVDDHVAWEAGESLPGDRPVFSHETEGDEIDRRGVQRPRVAKVDTYTAGPPGPLDLPTVRMYRAGEQMPGVEAKHSRGNAARLKTTTSEGVPREGDLGPRFIETDERKRTQDLQNLFNRVRAGKVPESALTDSQRKALDRLGEEYRVRNPKQRERIRYEDGKPVKPNEEFGTEENFTTSKEKLAEREARTPTEPADRTPVKMPPPPADRVTRPSSIAHLPLELVRLLDETARGGGVVERSSPARGGVTPESVWARYITQRLKDLAAVK
jgi:hypothetical protein